MAIMQQPKKYTKVVFDMELMHDGYVLSPEEKLQEEADEGDRQYHRDMKARWSNNTFEQFNIIERFIDPSNTTASLRSTTLAIKKLLPPPPAFTHTAAPLGKLWGVCYQMAEQIPYNHPSMLRLAALVRDLSSQSFAVREVWEGEGFSEDRSTVTRPEALGWQYMEDVREAEFSTPSVPKEEEYVRWLNLQAYFTLLVSHGVDVKTHLLLEQLSDGLETIWDWGDTPPSSPSTPSRSSQQWGPNSTANTNVNDDNDSALCVSLSFASINTEATNPWFDLDMSCYAAVAALCMLHNGAAVLRECATPVRHEGSTADEGREYMRKSGLLWYAHAPPAPATESDSSAYPPSTDTDADANAHAGPVNDGNDSGTRDNNDEDNDEDNDNDNDAGAGYSMARWHFWKGKFRSIAAGERVGATDEARVLSRKAARYMDALEDRLDF